MVKTRRRSGGKKRKTRCWRRRGKNGRRYTVCRGSRGEKGKYKKKRRTRYAKKRLRQRGGYSGINVPLSPSNFQGPSQPTLPPFGPVNVPVRGVTKVHDGEYYYLQANSGMITKLDGANNIVSQNSFGFTLFMRIFMNWPILFKTFL